MEKSDMKAKDLKRSIVLRSIVFLVFIFSPLYTVSVCAETFEEMYGPELKTVPYAYRVKYSNEYDQTWSEATYDDRLAFLLEIYKEEADETIALESEKYEKSLIESQKSIDRETKKMAEEQKKMEKLMIKANKKMQEDLKKIESQMKSVEQKQKISNMRSNQR
jgi:hypothetical protein